jgi:hypothetical protein
LSLRATEGSAAVSSFPRPFKIASVVLLPRNDVVTQSPGERTEKKPLPPGMRVKKQALFSVKDNGILKNYSSPVKTVCWNFPCLKERS